MKRSLRMTSLFSFLLSSFSLVSLLQSAALANGSAESDFGQAGLAQAAQGLKALSTSFNNTAHGLNASARPMLALPPGPSIDLSSQFPPGKKPNQGAIGDCHDFATVGMIESAYYRRYHEHQSFSEADLFAQSRLTNGLACNNPHVWTGADQIERCSLAEGGLAEKDLQFVLDHGILPDGQGKCAAYKDFHNAYVRDVQKPYEDAFLAFSQSNSPLPKLSPEEAQSQVAGLEKPSPDADAARDKIKEELRGFKVASRFFPVPNYDELVKISDKSCGEESVSRKDFIVSELRRGRPVHMGFYLANMTSWGVILPPKSAPPKSPLGHDVIIDGMREDPPGHPIFLVRNSWGKSWPDEIDSDQLCRVDTLSVFLTPEESANP